MSIQDKQGRMGHRVFLTLEEIIELRRITGLASGFVREIKEKHEIDKKVIHFAQIIENKYADVMGEERIDHEKLWKKKEVFK